jgi:hypothetical protein
LTSYERSLGVRTSRTGGVIFAGRDYTSPEIELYFALNSLASSLQLYSSVAPALGGGSSLQGASQVVVRAARQADRAVGRAGTARTTGVERDWAAVREVLAQFAQSNGQSIDREER